MRNYIIILFMLPIIGLFGCGDDNNDSGETDISNSIISTITVRSMPETLTVGLESTPENQVEYGWNVTFDIDNDGHYSEGDITFEIVEVKQSGDVQHEVQFQDLKAYAVAHAHEDGKSSRNELGLIDFEKSDNTLTFIVDRGLSDRLLLISYQTQIRVNVGKSIENQTTVDNIPNIGSSGYFTKLSDNHMVIDDANDYLGDDERFDIFQFELEIIE